MSFLVFIFLYAVLCGTVTSIFVRIRLSLSNFPFAILRISGFRLSPLLWPHYMTTIFLNPGRFRDGFQCVILWLVLGFSLVRVVLPPDVSFTVAGAVFLLGNIVLWGLSYATCAILESFIEET